MDTEYIFKQDFWGNWKLVPEEKDSGALIAFIIILLILSYDIRITTYLKLLIDTVKKMRI